MKALLPGAGLLALLLLTGCRRDAEQQAALVTGGDPALGQAALLRYGCGSCHTIPGVPGATATVGPPLQSLGTRTYLAGRLPNTPENLIQWVRHPQAVEPGNGMPELNVTEEDARHIAAYLYAR
ncbi:c-type cytochrome [Stigmatella hybrida]|uniref:c-type cytochrome n=1 Tax=Stigmatella hybrida TaxID=394097 RepID=UPI001CDA8D93|nr:c-type cytochrome [Stigmatella hybrida]